METSIIPGPATVGLRSYALIGAGRLGTALARAMHSAAIEVRGPFGRETLRTDLDGADTILLCVPDAAIAAAAAKYPPADGLLVGHCSGATGLGPIADAGHEAFSIHPLMTITRPDSVFTGAGCAIDGSTPRARLAASDLADRLGMRAVLIGDEDRVTYHAAASIASNFLITLQDAAEQLLSSTGAPRELLVPLVRAAVENWAADGGPAALTGPIARGDEATVQAQRSAVADRAPELLELFDALTAATRALAQRRPQEVTA